MAPIRSRGILISIMSSQYNTRYQKRTTPAPFAFKPTYEERLLGSQKIQLLKAPGVDSDVMWKQQCFESVYNRLRAKLNDSCSADNLISVFNAHFPISTLPAEDQARTALAKFKSAFGDIKYLSPTAFLNRNGKDVTGHMYDTPRPAHVCHLGVHAEVLMQDISSSFDKDMVFAVDYFLPLPQSAGRSSVTPLRPHPSKKSTDTPTLGSAEVMDAGMFSPSSKSAVAVDLTREVLDTEDSYSTPVLKNKTLSSTDPRSSPLQDQEDSADDTDNSVNVDTTQDPGVNDNSVMLGGNTLNDFTPQGNNSFQEMFTKSPKSASLILHSKNSTSSNVAFPWTYEGPMGILDDGDVFRSQIPVFDGYYNLVLSPNGTRNVIEKKDLLKKLKRIENVVQFRVFSYEFRKSYVGNDGNNLAQLTATIQSCASKLRGIKMVTKDYSSGKITVITPDLVFSRMLEYIQLLPDDASNWGFCLPWVYLESLSYELQEDLRDNGYLPPSPTILLTKSAQLEATVNCRDRARLANKRIRDLKKQVARAIESKPTSSYRGSFLSEDTDNENSYSNYADGASVNFNNGSRAEQTLATELYKKRKRANLPPDFQQKFVTINQKQFPCHPLEGSRHSDFPVGFDGCLGCGSVDHRFNNCKTRNTPEGKKNFHFQLHCHHPDIFFRNFDESGNFRGGSKEGKSSENNSHGLGRGVQAVVPSWLSAENDGLAKYRKAENDMAPQYVILLDTYNIQKKMQIRRMPITSHNELPHIRFPVGSNDEDGSLLNLFDTGAALNTGQLSYHMALKKMRPDLIASYEEFNGTNPFEPIKLCGAIQDPSTYSTERHGILSAVIRYKTPFVINGRAITLDFALGKDVSVNSILGFPSITELQLVMQFRPWPHVSSPILERVFKVEFREAACGFMAEQDATSDLPSMSVTLGKSTESSNNVTSPPLKSYNVDQNVNDTTPHKQMPLPPLPTNHHPSPPSPAVE